jgi:hypothetical protein
MAVAFAVGLAVAVGIALSQERRMSIP